MGARGVHRRARTIVNGDTPLLVAGFAVAVAWGFVAGHYSVHRLERARRRQLASRYDELANRWSALAAAVYSDDKIRAGIDIGTNYVLTALEQFVADQRSSTGSARRSAHENDHPHRSIE